MNSKIKLYVGLSALVGGSFGAGYFAALKKTEKEIEHQVKAAHAFYAKQYKTGEYSTVETTRDALRKEGELFQNAVEAINDYQTVKDGEELPEEDENRIILDREEEPRRRVIPQKGDLKEVIEHLKDTGGIKQNNIFAGPRPAPHVVLTGEDQEGKEGKEVANVGDVQNVDKVDDSKPYLVSQEVFTEPREEYALVEFTLYTGDDTVANDKDEILDDAEVERIIGSDNLNMFGYLEDDPHIVLVRNDQLLWNIEVTLSHRKYGENVAGFVPEGDDG
jgi:hypothetical protein